MKQWRDLQGEEFALRLQEMLEKKQYRELRGAFSLFEAADIALLFEEFEDKELLLFFRLLPKETAAEVFVEMDPEQKESLINSFSDAYLREVLAELYVDDTVELIEEMPAGVVRRILRNADEVSREDINRILQYPKDSAGSMMTTEYVRLYKDMTVSEAFTRIRRDAYDKETVYTCYVTDENRRLIGVVTVRDLLVAEEDAVIGDIMTENVIRAETHDDRETVANALSKYDFLALPVVDKGERLVGIVTYDDASDVLQEEITEDIEKMAAIVPTDKPYLRTGAFETWSKRIPWLILLLLSATFTGAILSTYESALSKVAVLTVFIPMLMGTAGNAGSQASVAVIRALSLGEVEMRDVLAVLWKELRVSLLCGVTLGLLGFGKAILLDGASVIVALVVSVTLAVTVLLAKLAGCLLPLGAKRIGVDPAVMARPFITTIVDTLSRLVYFAVATALIPELG